MKKQLTTINFKASKKIERMNGSAKPYLISKDPALVLTQSIINRLMNDILENAERMNYTPMIYKSDNKLWANE